MALRHRLLSSTALGTALVAALSLPAVAEDAFSLPAVSAPNGKLGAFGGVIGDDFTLGASGSFAVPLHDQWGGQVDGLLGTAGGNTYYGVGGHLFWRDPSKGLLGLYGSWVGWSDSVSTIGVTTNVGPDAFQDVGGSSIGKVGIEGEMYLERMSLEGLAAYQFGTNTGFAGRATVAYYPTDDLRFDLGIHHLVGPGLGVRGGLEWQPSAHNFSLFANVSAGASNSWSAIGGLKLYVGESGKSLIRRHREDDPENLLVEDLYQSAGGVYCPDGYFFSTDDGGSCFSEGT